MKNSQVLKEVIVTVNEDSLNRAIAEKHIITTNIIAVIYQPGGALAIGDYQAKYRVIYRT